LGGRKKTNSKRMGKVAGGRERSGELGKDEQKGKRGPWKRGDSPTT